MKRLLILILCAYGVSGFSGTFTAGRTFAGAPTITKADVDRWMTELSNWGRWGKTDQIGTLNLITAEKRKQALKLARDGVSVSLAHTLEKEQLADNPRPIGQQMTLDTAGHAMDLYTIWYHGSTITHIDSLCHYSFEGKIFNGYARSEIAQGPGCPSNGIEQQKRDVALLGNDGVNDVQPSGIEGSPRPIHQVAIVALGLPLVDVMDLDAAAETAARLKRWEFLVTAAAIPVPGGTGFPLNPIATF